MKDQLFQTGLRRIGRRPAAAEPVQPACFVQTALISISLESSFMKSRIQFFCIAALLILCCAPAFSQLTIAPTAVFIDAESRTGEIMMKNTTQQPREVSVELKFAYPGSDENGNLEMKTDPEAERYSLIPHVKFFPRKLVIQAGQTQTVKFLLMPKRPLENMAYWARLHVFSKPVVKPLEVALTDSASAQIIIAVEQVTAAILINGPISTSIDVENVFSLQDSGQVFILSKITRNGNTPFWGRESLRVYNSRGELVHQNMMLISVYYSMVSRFPVDKSALPSGEYTAELTITSDRDEIPVRNRTKIETIVKKINFTVQ